MGKGYGSYGEDGGEKSQWHEGNLANLRFHISKSIINFSKTDLLSYNNDLKKFNYEIWIASIDNIYWDGLDKYSETEIEDCEKIRKLIHYLLENKPPYKVIYVDSRQGKKQIKVKSQQDWKVLKEIVELFERKIRRLNNDHGYSTGSEYYEEGL